MVRVQLRTGALGIGEVPRLHHAQKCDQSEDENDAAGNPVQHGQSGR